MVGVAKGHDPKWVGKGGDGCITTKSVSMSGEVPWLLVVQSAKPCVFI